MEERLEQEAEQQPGQQPRQHLVVGGGLALRLTREDRGCWNVAEHTVFAHAVVAVTSTAARQARTLPAQSQASFRRLLPEVAAQATADIR